jgi:hypothetical protein
MNGTFDLIETQGRIREMTCPKALFEAWERMSYAYLRRELTKYDLDEIKSAVFEQFRLIDEAEKSCNQAA